MFYFLCLFCFSFVRVCFSHNTIAKNMLNVERHQIGHSSGQEAGNDWKRGGGGDEKYFGKGCFRKQALDRWIYTGICKYRYIYTHARACTNIHIYTRTYTYTHAHTHIHTHIHRHSHLVVKIVKSEKYAYLFPDTMSYFCIVGK